MVKLSKKGMSKELLASLVLAIVLIGFGLFAFFDMAKNYKEGTGMGDIESDTDYDFDKIGEVNTPESDDCQEGDLDCESSDVDSSIS